MANSIGNCVTSCSCHFVLSARVKSLVHHMYGASGAVALGTAKVEGGFVRPVTLSSA